MAKPQEGGGSTGGGSWGTEQLGVLEQKVERKTLDFKVWGKGKKTCCGPGAAHRVDGKHVLG